MKLAIRFLFATFLAVVLVTTVNAQTPSRSEIYDIQRKLDKVSKKIVIINNKVETVKSQASDLKAKQTVDEVKISDTASTVSADHNTLLKTTAQVQSNKSLTESIADRLAEFSNTAMWISIAASIILLVGAAYLVWWLKGFKKTTEECQEALEDKVFELSTKLEDAESVIEQLPLYNPPPEYLGRAWRKSAGKKPEDRPIRFGVKFVRDLSKKGHDLQGIVNGYTAIFVGNETWPTIHYQGGEPMKYREMWAHAAEILKRREAARESKLQ